MNPKQKVTTAIKRHPHRAAQVVTIALMWVLIRVLGQNAANDAYIYVIVVSPLIAAWIAERFTVPWAAVLKWLEQVTEAHAPDGMQARKLIERHTGTKLPE